VVADPPARRSVFHVADVLLPISLILWAIGLHRSDPNNLGGYGLVTSLSPIFYAGLVVLVVSALLELGRPRPSRWRMSAHAAVLVVILYATPAIVYAQGRYSWLYKTIGVVQFVNHYGHLEQHVDIYQNWPGFFALAAWFDKVAGVGTPLDYAKWAQVVFELAALPLLYLIYSALSLSVWQRWMALLLYAGSNWIGQDYFSPQAVGTIISLGIMALILRWLYGGNRDPLTRRRRFVRKRAAVPQAARQPDRSPTVSRVEVYEAYRTMRGYQGPPGIDGMTVRDFEQHLPRNLQRVWTQLRDGTYEPSPARIVPPPGGRGKPLSVLTVSDMIAQIVVARKLEAEFRRRREADLERLSQRSRVAPGRWKVEVDAHSVFTSCRHDLLLRVVEAATEEEWLAGYVSRFLRASERQPDAFSGSRRLGTMPGTPLSTVLADLFLYYALDRWAMDHFPEVKLFRELDSAVVHCQTEQQARSIRAAIWQRLEDVSLKVTKADIQVDQATQGEQTEVFAMPTAEVRNAARLTDEQDSSEDRAAKRAAKARTRAGKGRSWAVLITLMMLFFVLSFTHELSPYILIVQIAVLAGGRLMRPRWLPIAFAAIAFGYLLPRLSYVNSQYGLLSSIGSFFSNVAPPSATTDTIVTIPSSQIFDQRAADVLSLLMWLLALIGAWRLRRSGKTVLALVALTFSPALVLAAQAYGNEGVLRVYLFSLPWAAALAAAALEPRSAALSRISAQLRGLRPGAGPAASPDRGRRRRAILAFVRPALGLGLVLALFFPSFFGDDASNIMTESETMIILHFLQTAKVGPIYNAGDNAPTQDTWRYPDFQMPTIFGTGDGDPLVTKATPNLADIIAKDSVGYTDNKQPAYVMISPSMVQYSIAFGETSPESYTILIDSLNKSPKWKLLVNQDGTSIYELPPGKAEAAAPAPAAKRKA
jgi:retron-type reverse transcriptase